MAKRIITVGSAASFEFDAGDATLLIAHATNPTSAGTLSLESSPNGSDWFTVTSVALSLGVPARLATGNVAFGDRLRLTFSAGHGTDTRICTWQSGHRGLSACGPWITFPLGEQQPQWSLESWDSTMIFVRNPGGGTAQPEESIDGSTWATVGAAQAAGASLSMLPFIAGLPRGPLMRVTYSVSNAGIETFAKPVRRGLAL